MSKVKDAIIPFLEPNDYGIAIDPNLCEQQLGKLKKINYPNFKYVNKLYDIGNQNTNEEKKVHFIEIKHLPMNLVREICNTINDILEEKDITVAAAIDEIIDYFKKVKLSKLCKKQLLGDIGEALFILECAKHDIDIQPYLGDIDDNNLYDFVIGNFNIEVKSASSEKNEFYLTKEQLDQTQNKNIVICKFKKMANETNIIQIYEKIQQKYPLCKAIQRKLTDWKNLLEDIKTENEYINNILDNYSIKLENVKFGVFKNNSLPIIDVKSMNACKKIELIINCTNNELEPFDELIQKIEKLIKNK